jgi:uncharacterized membrane protein
MPSDELESAIQYYEEYFDEAGDDQKAAEELGSPEKAASMIKANYAVQDMEKSEGSAKKSLKTIFIVILAIFASPIAIPIAITIFAVIISLVVALLAVFVSLFAAGAATAAVGFLTLIASVFVIVQSPATFLFFLGLGLVSIATGVALILVTAFICKVCFGWIASGVSRLVLGRGKK